LNLRDLEYLLALADVGHFGRAAAACGISQPTLSAQIGKLEAELGALLFERRRRALRATAVGERVIAQARRVVEEAAALAAIARNADAQAAPLRIGLDSTLAAGALGWLAPALAATFPTADPVLKEDSEAALLAAIAARGLDAALVPMPGGDSRLGAEPLFDEPLVAVLAAGHVLAARGAIDPRDLARHPVLLPPAGLREIVIAACALSETEIAGASEAASLETLQRMAAAGLGASLVPALSQPEAGGAIVVRPCVPAPKRRIALVWRRGARGAEAMRRLADAIRERLPRTVKPVARRAAG